MNEQTKEIIKQTLNSQGWPYIEQMLKEEFVEGKKPLNFKTKDKSNEQIAREATARELNARAVTNFINRINRIKNEQDEKRKVFR